MTAQFVKVGSQFINMALVQNIIEGRGYPPGVDWEHDNPRPCLRLNFKQSETTELSIELFEQERADLLAWLTANSADVSAPRHVDLPNTPILVELSGDEKDAEIRKLRSDLDALWKLLRAIDDTAPLHLETLSAEGFSQLAATIEEVRAALPTPF